ncbi:MAG TPA: TetR family transcriptional regulator [Streptosporangiaceae bacterium]
MSRWRPDARERLERAALELFAEQGFAATTVPEITARAGLTTRTFFRYFADKREVIFGGAEIPDLATQLITDAPASLDPVTLVFGGLQTVAETRFEGRREELRQRLAIIRSDEGLRERDLRKRANLGEAIRAGFISRGVAAVTAALLAEITTTVLFVALDEWIDRDDERTLFETIVATLGSLQETLAAFPMAGAGSAAAAAPSPSGAGGVTPMLREP